MKHTGFALKEYTTRRKKKSLFNQMSNPGSFTKKRRSKVRYIQQEKKYKKKALKNRLIALESVKAYRKAGQMRLLLAQKGDYTDL